MDGLSERCLPLSSFTAPSEHLARERRPGPRSGVPIPWPWSSAVRTCDSVQPGPFMSSALLATGHSGGVPEPAPLGSPVPIASVTWARSSAVVSRRARSGVRDGAGESPFAATRWPAQRSWPPQTRQGRWGETQAHRYLAEAGVARLHACRGCGGVRHACCHQPGTLLRSAHFLSQRTFPRSVRSAWCGGSALSMPPASSELRADATPLPLPLREPAHVRVSLPARPTCS